MPNVLMRFALRFREYCSSEDARATAVFTSTSLLALVLGLVGSFVQARFVGPEDLGLFRTFGIVVGYASFLHMGVFDGLQREIPYQIGRGDRKAAEAAVASCLVWITAVSMICGFVFVSLAVLEGARNHWREAAGWLAHSFAIVGAFYGTYLNNIFRSTGRLLSLSKPTALEALAGAVTLPTFPLFGYYGACLRTGLSSGVALVALHWYRPFRTTENASWGRFLSVIRVGFSFSITGYVATALWTAVEGTFVLRWFGVEALGLFSIAVLVRTVINQLLQNMLQVMTIKVYQEYGRTGRASSCLAMVWRPSVLLAVAIGAFALIGWWAVPRAVDLLLPKYTAAGPLIRIALILVPISAFQLYGTILRAINMPIRYFWSVAPGFVLFLVCSYVLRGSGLDCGLVLIASAVGQGATHLICFGQLSAVARNEQSAGTM